MAASNDEGEILLLKRPDRLHCGGLWSFPGGKIEPDEKSAAAAAREFAEETGLSGRDWRHVGQSSHSYPDRDLRFELFSCRIADASMLDAESEHAWVPPEQLPQYPMPAANQALLDLLIPEDCQQLPAK